MSLLIMAEGFIEAEARSRLGGQSEDLFVAHGFGELLESQSKEAEAQPDGCEPRISASRASSSLERSIGRLSPWRLGRAAVRTLLRAGDATLVSAGRRERPGARPATRPGWDGRRVEGGAQTGHAMGLQNPHGLAKTIAEVLPSSWGE